MAIRKAKQPAKGSGGAETEVGLDQEIAYCAHLAQSVLMYLVMHQPDLFPSRKMPWYVPNDEDTPK